MTVIFLTINVLALLYISRAHKHLHKLKKENEFLKFQNETNKDTLRKLISINYNLKNNDK